MLPRIIKKSLYSFNQFVYFFTLIFSEKEQLSSDMLRNISESIKYPTYTEHIGDITFSVFRAKKAFNSKWQSRALRRLVIEARKTYQEHYGHTIKEIDEYDKKSTVYIVKVEYPIKVSKSVTVSVEEWFSARFVPSAGSPLSTEDLDFYIYKNDQEKMPLLSAIIKYIEYLQGISEQEALERIVTLSRLCAIRPYAAEKKYQKIFEKYLKEITPVTQNRYSGLSFALINKQFLIDIHRYQYQFRIITCQMHYVLSNKILTHPAYSGRKKMPLTFAYKELGFKNKNIIRIDRNKPGVYAYQFPGYFLDLPQLVKFLQKLIDKKTFTEEVIEKHLPLDIKWQHVLENPRSYHFRFMGHLFTRKGLIEGTQITGEQLRYMLDHEVQDGPVCRIIDIAEWEKQIDSMINFGKKYEMTLVI